MSKPDRNEDASLSKAIALEGTIKANDGLRDELSSSGKEKRNSPRSAAWAEFADVEGEQECSRQVEEVVKEEVQETPIPPGRKSEEHHSIKVKQDNTKEDDLEATDAGSSSVSLPFYTIFSKKKVRFIIFMAAFAGFVSPLSATIYLPLLNTLSHDLHVSSTDINLTLTTYMIFQGLAPTLFGDLADTIGRRPVFIFGFIVYIGACLGLALQHSFVALLMLRCLQSVGTSSTVAISVSVAADVSTHSERGKYMGWVTSGTAVGTAIGPVLGGILSHFLGWQSVFWFLIIAVCLYMVPLVLAFPETARNVVGNGSIRPQEWNITLLSYLAEQRQTVHKNNASPQSQPSLDYTPSDPSTFRHNHPLRFPNPLNSLKLIIEKDTGPLLFYNAIVYTAFNTIIASTPYLFSQIYHLDELQIGLCYLPFGVASFLAPLLNGRLLDWNFRRVAARAGIAVDKRRAQNMVEFPLESARVPVALPMAILGAAALLCYGWVIEVEGPLAAPLVLQFIIGLTVTGCFQVMNVMIVDYYPISPATATASNNLVRCWMGGAGGALIIPMIDSMGRGWCFTFVALVLLLSTSILLVLQRWGPKWRKVRMMREDEKQRQEMRV